MSPSLNGNGRVPWVRRIAQYARRPSWRGYAVSVAHSPGASSRGKYWWLRWVILGAVLVVLAVALDALLLLAERLTVRWEFEG